jgi:DNA mismatch repair protein MutS
VCRQLHTPCRAEADVPVTQTPMMKQYTEIKKQYQDALLFFRLGDFYEMFGEDAQIAAKELEIALTSREAGNAGRIPMCGVPYHAVNSYLDKLVSKGYRVAICEQLEDPKQAKGVVKRDVVRVVTPGTFIEGSLEDKRSQYLTAVAQVGESFGAASLDVSTGQFLVTELASFAQLEDELLRLSPAELVAGSSSPILERLRAAAAHLQITISEVEQRLNPVDDAAEALRRHFQVATLEPFGLNTPAKTLAAGMALAYAQQTQKGILEHILKVQTYTLEQFLQIDAHSRQNLELTRTIRDGRKAGSLLGVIDQTRTSMGGRMLRWNLEQPLVSPEEITQRQDAVACLVENASLRLEVQELLDQVYDLERLMGRLTVGTGNARDLRALCSSLQVVPRVKELLAGQTVELLRKIGEQLDPLPDLAALIDRAIVDNPPISVRDGGLVKTGFSPELDELRAASRDGKTWIKNLEAQERKRTGIKSLKVGFNKVFGYYIEVTNPNLDLVPEDYQRKQTLSNAERFITPELKEKESLILGADERSVEMEYALFCQVRDQAKEHMGQIQANAAALAFLDMLQSLAEAAVRHNYVRPVITTDTTLEIVQGRHPVLETLQNGFVPNDLALTDAERIILLTGPNMAGKSTYLRQTALIVILAQVGSFVPAQAARIGLVDRIFTRIGAADDLSTGQSTFMVECAETAYMLLNATERSLIILDELGRGTSTFDGMAIAQAVIEHIHDRIGARTLFSTHFHELTKLEQSLPKLAAYRVEVQEKQGTVYFLHQVSRGSTDKSYGVNVARMAGIPRPVLKRALSLLQELEAERSKPLQLDLFASLQYDATAFDDENEPVAEHPVVEQLKTLDINRLTPLEALQLLAKWQQDIKEAK